MDIGFPKTVITRADGEFGDAERTWIKRSRPRILAVDRQLDEALVWADDRFEYVRLDERCHRAEQVLCATKATPFHIQKVERQRSAPALIDRKAGDEIGLLRRVGCQKSAKCARILMRRCNHKDGRGVDRPVADGNAQKIVDAVESHDSRAADLYQLRLSGSFGLLRMPFVP